MSTVCVCWPVTLTVGVGHQDRLSTVGVLAGYIWR
jgi:hypothetical protein